MKIQKWIRYYLMKSSGTAERGKSSVSRFRAACWKNFDRGQKYPNGKTEVTCKYCEQTYHLNLRRNGTNTMNRHMRSCEKTPGSTPRISRKVDMMVFREMIAVALVQHNLPYSFVEYERIREAFTYANPYIEFWSRNTVASDVYKIYEREKIKLKEKLAIIPGRICLTTDLWRALTVESYICLTAHYVDVDGVLKTKILSFCAFPPPHSGVAIAMKLSELLKDWGIEKKVFTLTGFYSYFSERNGTGKSPLDMYLEEPVLDMVSFRDMDVIAYWKNNVSRFKELSSMACDILSIPITTVASESAFSIAFRLIARFFLLKKLMRSKVKRTQTPPLHERFKTGKKQIVIGCDGIRSKVATWMTDFVTLVSPISIRSDLSVEKNGTSSSPSLSSPSSSKGIPAELSLRSDQFPWEMFDYTNQEDKPKKESAHVRAMVEASVDGV
ncbi:Zinc finger BED-type [Arabidopsis thaliana x Arabidopsis arenosa]|uniref:Zinc finger BED-type n=1 Tax=Arabidopsis thaliana x Arabidopsis arenosa TaxID=1240361 RepID=A0A8T2GDJ7_9BRAS|nr:Zinc finger BED-type [Arabidopsis thaliana x Arabidopsis arenosa]